MKFSEDGNDLYEPVTTKWVLSMDEDAMKATVAWPPNNSKAGYLSRMEKPAEASWAHYEVQIMRFCGKCLSVVHMYILFVGFV